VPDVIFAKKEDIPQELHKDVREENGKFVVNLALNSTVKEFRDTNIQLRNERDALKSELDPFKALGIEDVAKFKEELPVLRQTAQQVADGKLKGTDAIEREVAKRVSDAVKEKDTRLSQLETQLNAAQGKIKEADGRYGDLFLTTRISEEARGKDSPVNPEAVADIVSRARSFGWQVNEAGELSATRNGQPIYSEKDPGKPLSLNEWLGGVVKSAPYLGKQSAGGGAGGGAGQQGKDEYFRSEAFQKLSPADKLTKAREMGVST
jgi:hypothetical protein